jgi:predicted DCC family thiol-disulfide oxidoreductase YuxK
VGNFSAFFVCTTAYQAVTLKQKGLRAGRDGYLRLLPVLGGAWRLLEITRLIPEALRNALYRLVARNRYRWFGHHEHCSLLTPDQRSRLVG